MSNLACAKMQGLWRLCLPDRFLVHRNTIEFTVWGRYALFTDPLTRVGGEKCSYHLPTYEALKGICKSIYWKPTFIWYVDQARLMRRIRTQTRGMKPLEYTAGGNTLAIYTYLTGDARSEKPVDLTDGPGVEYQVRAHFEWNPHQPALAGDQNEGKHFAVTRRSLTRGGRQDIFLGTRDCQGYVAPCRFGEGASAYDGDGSVDYSLMFHSFSYPDETGDGWLATNFWRPKLADGVLTFPRPDDKTGAIVRKEIRPMTPKQFGIGKSLLSVDEVAKELSRTTGTMEENLA
jgi:CRISPR-associated protein Cas5d